MWSSGVHQLWPQSGGAAALVLAAEHWLSLPATSRCRPWASPCRAGSTTRCPRLRLSVLQPHCDTSFTTSVFKLALGVWQTLKGIEMTLSVTWIRHLIWKQLNVFLNFDFYCTVNGLQRLICSTVEISGRKYCFCLFELCRTQFDHDSTDLCIWRNLNWKLHWFLALLVWIAYLCSGRLPDYVSKISTIL